MLTVPFQPLAFSRTGRNTDQEYSTPKHNCITKAA